MSTKIAIIRFQTEISGQRIPVWFGCRWWWIAIGCLWRGRFARLSMRRLACELPPCCQCVHTNITAPAQHYCAGTILLRWHNITAPAQYYCVKTLSSHSAHCHSDSHKKEHGNQLPWTGVWINSQRLIISRQDSGGNLVSNAPFVCVFRLPQTIVTFFADEKSCITKRSNSSAQSRFVRCSRTATRRQFKKCKVQRAKCKGWQQILWSLNPVLHFLCCQAVFLTMASSFWRSASVSRTIYFSVFMAIPPWVGTKKPQQ